MDVRGILNITLPETGHNHLYWFPLVPIAKYKEINILFFPRMYYCFIIYKFHYLDVICRFSLYPITESRFPSPNPMVVTAAKLITST